MSYVKVPPFDVLAGDTEPFTGFGDVLPPSAEVSETFLSEAENARRRLEDGFKRDLKDPKLAAQRLDEIIAEMWAQGWSPKVGNVALFTRDFGLVLTTTVLSLCGGMPVNDTRARFLGPLFREGLLGVDQATLHLLDGTNLGRLADVKVDLGFWPEDYRQ